MSIEAYLYEPHLDMTAAGVKHTEMKNRSVVKMKRKNPGRISENHLDSLAMMQRERLQNR